MRSVVYNAVPLAAVVLALLFSATDRPGAPPPPPRPRFDDGPVGSAPGAVRGEPGDPASATAALQDPNRPDAFPGEGRIEIARGGALRVCGRPVPPSRLAERLAAFADEDRDESTARKLSRRAVRVVADPETPWRIVRQALSDCTRPEVRIVRLRLTAGKTERIAVAGDRVQMPGVYARWEERPVITVALSLGPGSPGPVRVKLLDQELGHDDAAFSLLARRVGQIARMNRGLAGEIVAVGELPARIVVRTLSIYRRAGVPETHIRGLPPRSWAAELLIRAIEDRDHAVLDERLRAVLLGEGEYRVAEYLWEEGRDHADDIAVRVVSLLSAEQEKDGFQRENWKYLLHALGEPGARALGEAARLGSAGALTVLGRWYPRSLTIHALPGIRVAASSRESSVRILAVRALVRMRRHDRRAREELARIADDPLEALVLRSVARDALAAR